MKKLSLLMSLTILLTGCNSKNVDIDNLVSNKETFIFSLTSDSCSHCQNLKKSYKKSNYDFNYYFVEIDELIENVQKGKDQELYIKYATLYEDSYYNVKSYVYGKSVADYVKEYAKDEKATLIEKDYYLKGYADLVFPLTFFYVQGEIVAFEYGDYSASLDKVMQGYEKDVSASEI